MSGQFYYDSAYFTGSDLEGQTAETYEPRAIMSIDTSDFLYGTFWLVKNGVVIKSGLGVAEYRVFNKSGALVSGLSQTGIAADAEGQYKITAVLATALTDFNHYLVEVTISYQSQDRIGYVGISLAE